MNSIMSSFKVYEILRIIIPGFYLTSMIYIILKVCYELNEKCIDNDFIIGILFIVFAIFIGGTLYSIDYPRLFRGILRDLPTNLMRKNNPGLYLGKEDREVEEEYYLFYYRLDSDSKIKTEIQSGFYHLFLNMSLVGLISFIIIAFHCDCFCLTFFLWLNFSFLILGLLSAASMYKFRLRFSWKKNYNEFVEFKKKEDEKNENHRKNEL